MEGEGEGEGRGCRTHFPNVEPFYKTILSLLKAFFNASSIDVKNLHKPFPVESAFTRTDLSKHSMTVWMILVREACRDHVNRNVFCE